MVAHARAAADLGEPEVEEAGFTDAQHHAGQMDDYRRYKHPDGSEYQEQLCRNHGIGSEIAVRDACEHLRPRKRHKQMITLDIAHRSTANRGS